MRHVLLLGSPATGTHRVSYATAAAGLVAPASGALGMISGLLRTAVATVDLAAVAMTADEHLSAAANAQKQPAGDPLSLGIAGTWTAPAMGGILPRHACSARCGARRRSGLGGLGRRRACPADLAGYHRAIVRSTGAAMLRSCARSSVDMWTTQGRCPHTHKPSKQQPASTLIVLEWQASDPACHSPASVLGSGDASPCGCAIYARILTAIHNLVPSVEADAAARRNTTRAEQNTRHPESSRPTRPIGRGAPKPTAAVAGSTGASAPLHLHASTTTARFFSWLASC